MNVFACNCEPTNRVYSTAMAQWAISYYRWICRRCHSEGADGAVAPDKHTDEAEYQRLVAAKAAGDTPCPAS